MTGTVINRLNSLGKYQPEHLTFREIKSDLLEKLSSQEWMGNRLIPHRKPKQLRIM